MHAAKPILCWIVILCCWQETQAKTASRIYTLNRSRVALAGQSLDFNLSVVVTANDTSKLECYRNNRNIWSKEIRSDFSEITKWVTAQIPMHNSSSSGNYCFRYAHQEVHWVVQVRDKGYEEPPYELDSDIITMMAFSGILLIFSVAGSLYILKSYKKQRPCGDERNEGAEQRQKESDNVILDEDAASASYYTALQYKSDSIYDTLDPEIMADEGNSRKKKSDIKHCEAQEDEVFDTLYENL